MLLVLLLLPIIISIWAREFIAASGAHRFVHTVAVVAIDVTEHVHQFGIIVSRFASHSCVLAVVWSVSGYFNQGL
jgi:hypothetical protein